MPTKRKVITPRPSHEENLRSSKAFQDKLAATRNKDRRNQKVRMVTK